MINVLLAASLLGLAPAAPQGSFKEKILARMPEGQTPLQAVFSADGTKVAYRLRHEGKWHVAVNGRLGPPFRNIGSGPFFNAAGKRLAYIGVGENGMHAVVDGKLGPAHTSIRDLCFSPDGRRVGYVADKRIFIDFRPGPEVGRYTQMAFSADGSSFAQIVDAGRFGGTNMKRCVLVGGKKGPPYESVEKLCYGPKGKLLVYFAREDITWWAVIDGKRGPPFGSVRNVTFDPSGKKVAYIGLANKKECVVVDGQKGEAFDRVGVPVFSSDGTRVAYKARNGSKSLIVVDGQKLEECDGAEDPVFSPDGSLVAYPVRRASGWVVRVGDKEGLPCQRVSSLLFAPDGKSVAYLGVQRLNQFVGVFRFEGVGDVRGANFDQVKTPVYSPDGKYVAYAGFRKGKWVVVAGSNWGKECQKVCTPPRFEKSGKRVGYGAIEGRDMIWMVVDCERR